MPVINLTQENFDIMLEGKELVVLDFGADWCGPCKTFDPVFEEASNRYPEAFFGKVNITEEPEFQADFGIYAIPTVMILRENIIVFRESSAIPLSSLCSLIDKAKGLSIDKILSEKNAVSVKKR